jgi:hypothetical protein
MLTATKKVNVKNRTLEGFNEADMEWGLEQFESTPSTALYSDDKNKTSRKLSELTRNDRGSLFEYNVAKKIQRYTGIDCDVTNNVGSCDIRMYYKRRKIRIEVKSALITQSGQYLFQGVQPEKADFFVFVRIDPRHGPLYDVATASEVRYYVTKTNSISCQRTRFYKGEMVLKTLSDWIQAYV